MQKSIKKPPVLYSCLYLCPLWYDFAAAPSQRGNLNSIASEACVGPQHEEEVTVYRVKFCVLLFSLWESCCCHLCEPGLACWMMRGTWHYHPISSADNKTTARLVNRLVLDHRTLPAETSSDSPDPNSHLLVGSVIIHSGFKQQTHVTTDLFLFKKVRWCRIWNFFYPADDCHFRCIISFNGYFYFICNL